MFFLALPLCRSHYTADPLKFGVSGDELGWKLVLSSLTQRAFVAGERDLQKGKERRKIYDY
jgi:hypothetical protein